MQTHGQVLVIAKGNHEVLHDPAAGWWWQLVHYRREQSQDSPDQGWGHPWAGHLPPEEGLGGTRSRPGIRRGGRNLFLKVALFKFYK